MFEAVTPGAAQCGVAAVTPETALILSRVNNGGDLTLLVAEHRL